MTNSNAASVDASENLDLASGHWTAPGPVDKPRLSIVVAIPRMERSKPTFQGLDADQLTPLAREAVVNAVASTARAGIPLTGFVDGCVQTIQASDLCITKFLQEQSAGLGVPSIQIERDPDTGLLVGNVPGIPGAYTQGETVEELCTHLTEVLEMLQEHTAVALK